MITEQEVIELLLKKIDTNVVKFASGDKINFIQAEQLTKNIVFDDEIFYYLLMLAKIGNRDGYEGFPSEIIPRLHGLYRFKLVRAAKNNKIYSDIFKTLIEKKIDFICGYNISLNIAYSKNDILLSDNLFDIVVHKKDYDTVLKYIEESGFNGNFEIKICEDKYVWKKSIVTEFNGIKINALNPTSILLIYSADTCSSFVGGELYFVDNVADRMRWLYEYKVIEASPEGIDYRYLSKKCDSKYLRFVLMYVSEYYKDNITKKIVDKHFKSDDKYQKLIEALSRGEFFDE